LTFFEVIGVGSEEAAAGDGVDPAQQRYSRPIGPPRRFTALGLAALVAMTGLGSFALAASVLSILD
jgi:hypothetical protein